MRKKSPLPHLGIKFEAAGGQVAAAAQLNPRVVPEPQLLPAPILTASAPLPLSLPSPPPTFLPCAASAFKLLQGPTQNPPFSLLTACAPSPACPSPLTLLLTFLLSPIQPGTWPGTQPRTNPVQMTWSCHHCCRAGTIAVTQAGVGTEPASVEMRLFGRCATN